MQQIERYGVIALVFLLVTIVAISFWGDSKSPGFWARLTGKAQAKPEQVAKLDTPALPPQIADPNLPLSPGTPAAEPQPLQGLGQVNPPTSIDNPSSGVGTSPQPPFAAETIIVPPPTTAGPAAPPLVSTTPAPKTAPASGRSEYTVQRGDSLARIARTQLGAESRWQEIAALNPRLDPKSLSVGETILLPDGAAKATGPATLSSQRMSEPKASPAPKKSTTPAVAKKSGSSSRSCTVQKGDTLRSIARRELGDEKRWKEIAGVNPGVDPAKLAIGQRLKLPASAGGEQLAAVPASKTNAGGPRVR